MNSSACLDIELWWVACLQAFMIKYLIASYGHLVASEVLGNASSAAAETAAIYNEGLKAGPAPGRCTIYTQSSSRQQRHMTRACSARVNEVSGKGRRRISRAHLEAGAASRPRTRAVLATRSAVPRPWLATLPPTRRHIATPSGAGMRRAPPGEARRECICN